MIPGRTNSRIIQGLGVLLTGGGLLLLLDLLRPTTTTPSAAWAVVVALLGAGVALIGKRLGEETTEPRYPQGSRRLLVGGLAVGGVGAMIASGGLFPSSSNPAAVQVLAALLLLGGLGLVHRGRPARQYERRVLGYVLFTASLGAASLVVFPSVPGWAVTVVPLAALGLWISVRLELGESAPRHPAGSRPLLLAGLALAGSGALIASGGVLPASSNPGGVYVLAGALLFAGLALVHLGRSARHYERLLLGFVLFTASVGAASFLLFQQAQGWSLLAIPIAVLGLWTALRLELGEPRSA